MRVEMQGETESFIQPSAFIEHLLYAIERDEKTGAVWALYSPGNGTVCPYSPALARFTLVTVMCCLSVKTELPPHQHQSGLGKHTCLSVSLGRLLEGTWLAHSGQCCVRSGV